MENRLQKLTEKLYNEGLSKGKQEADRVLEQAHIEAKECIDKATLQAQHRNRSGIGCPSKHRRGERADSERNHLKYH